MFSLIITIISIALVAALAVATIYYGGAAFTQGTAKANAAALVAASQQVQGADTLYQNDNGGLHAVAVDTVSAVDLLVTKTYLQASPAMPSTVTAGTFVLTEGKIAATVTSKAMCEAIAKSAGSGDIGTDADTNKARPYDCYGAASPFTFRFG